MQIPKVSDLEKSAKAASENAVRLLNDAHTLYERGSLESAFTHSVLAREEFAKAGLLLICKQSGRWDEEVIRALRDHKKKQALANLLDELGVQLARQMEWRQRQPLPLSIPSLLSSLTRELMASVERESEVTIEKGETENKKQRLLYSNVSKSGQLISVPKESADAHETALAIDRASQLHRFVAFLQSPVSDCKFRTYFRAETRIVWDASGCRIEHSDGIDILIPGAGPAHIGPLPSGVENLVYALDATEDPKRRNRPDSPAIDFAAAASFVQHHGLLQHVESELRRHRRRHSLLLASMQKLVNTHSSPLVPL